MLVGSDPNVTRFFSIELIVAPLLGFLSAIVLDLSPRPLAMWLSLVWRSPLQTSGGFLDWPSLLSRDPLPTLRPRVLEPMPLLSDEGMGGHVLETYVSGSVLPLV